MKNEKNKALTVEPTEGVWKEIWDKHKHKWVNADACFRFYENSLQLFEKTKNGDIETSPLAALTYDEPQSLCVIRCRGMADASFRDLDMAAKLFFACCENAVFNKIAVTDIGTGAAIKIRYNDGTQPGTVREIVPMSFDDKYLYATCLASGMQKKFLMEKIEMAADDAEVTYVSELAEETKALQAKAWESGSSCLILSMQLAVFLLGIYFIAVGSWVAVLNSALGFFLLGELKKYKIPNPMRGIEWLARKIVALKKTTGKKP